MLSQCCLCVRLFHDSVVRWLCYECVLRPRFPSVIKGANALPPEDPLLRFLVDNSADSEQAVQCANCDHESDQKVAWPWPPPGALGETSAARWGSASVLPSMNNYIFLFFFLSFFPSACLSAYLSVCLTLLLPACLSVCLSLYLSVRLYLCLSLYLSVCFSVCPSFSLTVYLSVGLSFYLSIRLLPFLYELLHLGQMRLLNEQKHTIVADTKPIWM